jgi:hypothetical protein
MERRFLLQVSRVYATQVSSRQKETFAAKDCFYRLLSYAGENMPPHGGFSPTSG